MDLGLASRVAVVTGGGRGIGAATALFLSGEGVKVAVLDQDGEPALESAAAVTAAGGTALGLQCDVTNAAQVVDAIGKIIAEFGHVDILVNNAGIVRDRSILKMEEADWDSVIDVTLKGSFHCSRAVIPKMREQRWGRIINLASRSMFGNPGQTNYAAAKAGVVGFTRSLSLEQASYGITVNAIAPGFIETKGIQSIPNYASLRATAVSKSPVGFLGEPDDIAGTVAFVASDRARYITGTTIFVTGGRYSS